ncbi:MAG: type II secretion system F family protein [Lachnospiraceae bacterium]|nr:type II secretion system F family protein [Lachnospiraceae bacterium]
MTEHKMLSNKEIASFCSEAAMLIQAGITPYESMRVMCKSNKSESGRQILNNILKGDEQKLHFHKALAQVECFPPYVVNTIRLGEESGNLDNCLFALSDYYEKEDLIYESIKNATLYPFVMIMMMLAVIFVLITKVMPVFERVFNELGSHMSGIAAHLLNLGRVMEKYSLFLLIVLLIMLFGMLFCVKTKRGQRALKKFMAVFPLTKGFMNAVACERFASSLALCLTSGMDTYFSLDMIKSLVENDSLSRKIDECCNHLKTGSNLSESLNASGIFNNLFSEMIAVGIKSGKTDMVLTKIAKGYEKESDDSIRRIVSVLEPTLVIILSLIVGLILLSVILPLMSIMSNIG